MRFSSSRTELFQLLLIALAITLCWMTITALNAGEFDMFRIILLISAVVIAAGSVFLSVNMCSLKIAGRNLALSSLFGTHIQFDITDISVYDINSFRLALVDPMKYMTFTKLVITVNGEKKRFFILNPSRYSHYHDIHNLLLSMYNKQVELDAQK
ncbi:MAG: hypothetical protein R6U95_00085 [Bacteroidales bacterium]